jgi:hypothetical protein
MRLQWGSENEKSLLIQMSLSGSAKIMDFSVCLEGSVS